MIGVRSPAEPKNFPSRFCVQINYETHRSSCPIDTRGPFTGIKRGRGVTLTTNPHLVPRSRMSKSYTSSTPRRQHGVWWDSFNFALFNAEINNNIAVHINVGSRQLWRVMRCLSHHAISVAHSSSTHSEQATGLHLFSAAMKGSKFFFAVVSLYIVDCGHLRRLYLLKRSFKT
jgi:hypothetical protein